MTDTPLDIKRKQLEIWLSKPPMERLKQMMEDNTSLNKFWMATRKSSPDSSNYTVKTSTSSEL